MATAIVESLPELSTPKSALAERFPSGAERLPSGAERFPSGSRHMGSFTARSSPPESSIAALRLQDRGGMRGSPEVEGCTPRSSLPPLPPLDSSNPFRSRFKSSSVSFSEHSEWPFSPDDSDEEEVDTSSFQRSATHRPTQSLAVDFRSLQPDIILQSQESWASKMAFLSGQHLKVKDATKDQSPSQGFNQDPRPEDSEPAVKSLVPRPGNSELAAKSHVPRSMSQDQGSAGPNAESRLARERARRELRLRERSNSLQQKNYPAWGKILQQDTVDGIPPCKRSVSLPNSLQKLRSLVGGRDDMWVPRAKAPREIPRAASSKDSAPDDSSLVTCMGQKGVTGLLSRRSKERKSSN